jgi:hypothetical protein
MEAKYMNNRLMKAIVVLAVVLIPLVSISAAAGPRAMPDLYIGTQGARCGVELSVPAPGILKNDIKTTGALQVKDPGMIKLTDQKLGTVKVEADGSFVYTAAANLPTSTYAFFYYSVTDGTSVSSQALVKIAVSCQCRGAAPDITVCVDPFAITPEFLMSEGAGCFGCRDATPKFDLSQIPAEPVIGECYPYTVACPACQLVTGHICFERPCQISWTPFELCSDDEPTEALIMANAAISCGDCDSTPEISNIHMVSDTGEYTDWEYTITCQSVCGPETEVGTFRLVPFCGFVREPLGFTLQVCSPEEMPTDEEIILNADLECTCPDTTPVITKIKEIGLDPEDPDQAETIWEYTAFCGSDEYPECGKIVTSQFRTRCDLPPRCFCTPTAPNLCSCIDFGFPTELFDLYEGGCHPAMDCDQTITMVIDDSKVDYTKVGLYDYTVTCNGCINSPVSVTGKIYIDNPTCGPDNTNCVCNCCYPGAPT